MGDRELKEISKNAQLSIEELIKEYGWDNKESCIFLDEEKSICSVYEYRPKVCEKFRCYNYIMACKGMENRIELNFGVDNVTE